MTRWIRKYPSRFFLFIIFSLVPLLSGRAEVDPDGGTNTSTSAAQNGVPIVNIARPNADGVSRNTYRDFDVNQQGLILNNSDQLGVSQLGGAILSNPNFKPGDGAQIILNEVTSSQQSSLNGYIETFGRQAEFILANPNGISCNGCGFINTSRATLITGSELDRSGAVGAFRLGPGQITVEGLGLNGSNVSYIDIITRAASIQATLQAKERLAILTGNDQYDYRTRQASSTAGSSAPVTYAIDASLLGSMYANQIELVTTEAGVGVRSAAEVIAQNDLYVDSTGSLVANTLQAGRNMNLNVADVLDQQGEFKAGVSLVAEADTLNLQQRIESGQNLKLVQRQGDLNLQNDVYGGTGTTHVETLNGSMTVSGNLLSNGLLEVSASGDVTNRGVFASNGNVNIDAGNIFKNESGYTVYAAEDLVVNTDADVRNEGKLVALKDMAINAVGNVTNTYGLIFAAENLAISLDGTLLNESNGDERGVILSRGNLTAKGLSGERMSQLINRGGSILSVGNMSLRADWLHNTHNVPVRSDGQPVVTINTGVDSLTGKMNWYEIVDSRLSKQHALIQSDRDIYLDLGSGRNTYSYIFAGKNLYGTVDSQFANESYTLKRAYTDSRVASGTRTKWRYKCSWHGCHFVPEKETYYYTVYFQSIGSTGVTIGSTLQAGEQFSLKVNGQFINGTGAPPGGSVSGNTSDTDVLEGLSLPPENSIFALNESPSREHNYLIETQFINTDDLLGSSYFLKQVGYQHTDDDTIFLGDAYYDQQLIADQVRAMAGQRFLFNDISSDNEQYQRLADQAALERERLGFVLGEELNDEQINSLEHDIVWYVLTQVDGYDVLAPRIYLSGATQEKIAAGQGARILGKEVKISAKELTNTGNISAEVALSLETEGDLINRGGTIESDGDATLIAGGDLISESIVWSKVYSDTERRAGISQVASIRAGGGLTLVADNDLTLTASQVSAGGDAKLKAGNQLALNTFELNNAHQFFDRGGLATEESTTHATSSLSVGGNLNLTSGSDMVLKGASVNAGGNASLDAGSNLLIESVQDTYKKVTTWENKGGTFSGGSTTTETIETATNKGSIIEAGGNLATSSNAHTLVLASELKSGGDMSLHSESGDIMLISGKDVDMYGIQSTSKGTVHTRSSGSGHYTETLAATSLSSGGDLSFTTNGSGGLGNITVAGAKVSSQGDMRFGEQVLANDDGSARHLSEADVKRIGSLRFDTVELENKEWSYSTKTLNGGIAALAVVAAPMLVPVIAETGLEIDKTDSVETRTIRQQGATLNSGGNFEAHTRGDITFVGTEVDVAGSGVLDAEGDVQVLAAADTTTRKETHRSAEVSDLTTQSDDSRYGVGFEGEYEETSTEASSTTLHGSRLNFGGDLQVKSGNDITLAASELSAGRDLSLDAARDLNILSDDEVTTLIESEIKGKASVTAGVGNAYNDFYQALENYKQAKEQRKAAEQALNDFDQELTMMRADLAKGLVTEEDIREREQDRKYYVISRDMAKVNEANALVQIGTQGAKMGAAATASGGTGFYTDVMVKVEGTKTDRRTDTTTAVGSMIQAGRDMQLSAGKDIHIQGSDTTAGRDISLDAGHDILIESAQHTQRMHEERRNVSYSYSMGTGGAGDGVSSWTASAGYGVDDTSSVTQRNSRLYAGGRFTSHAGQDTTFAGANVNAADLAIETGDDLTILSRQNRSRQRGMDVGVSLNGGGQRQGESQTDLSGVNGGHRSTDRRWTDQMTTLVGRNSVNIKTGDETTVKGAMVAQINDDGTDGGNLSLNTGSLIVEDIQDRDTAGNWSAGFSGSDNSTSVQFQNGGYVRGQAVHATLGQGDIALTKEYETVPDALNRDIDQLTTVTANRRTGGANVNVTVDHRMLSKEGWKDIATDFVDTYEHGTDVAIGLSMLMTEDDFGLDAYGNHIRDRYNHRELIKQQVHNEQTRAGINYSDASAEEVKQAFQNLSPDAEVNLYDGDPNIIGLDESGAEFNKNSTAGGYDRASGEIGVNIFAADMTSTEAKVNLIGHETYHGLADRGEYGFSDATEEDLAHSFGDMASSSWSAYSWIGGYDTDINSGSTSQAQWYLQNRTTNTVQSGNRIISNWNSEDVKGAHLRTPMSLAAQRNVSGRQWLGTESAARSADANGLDIDATNGYNFFGPVSAVSQQDYVAQEQAGVTRDNASQSALVLVEPGDTPASLENYIVEQMGPRFEAVYQHSPELQAQVVSLTADAKSGEYLNISPLWQWSVDQANQQAEQTSVYYADVVNKQGTVYDGSVPLFSSWLGGYGHNAAVTFDDAAPPAMQAYARNSLVYDLVEDILSLGLPVKGTSSLRTGAVRYGEGVANSNLATLEAKIANRTATKAEWKQYSSEIRKSGGSFDEIIRTENSFSKSAVAQIERRQVASNFYSSLGFSGERLASHLEGIDFSKPVNSVLLRQGNSADQWVGKYGVGNYFTEVGTPFTKLGIFPEGRTLQTFSLQGNVRALRSIAADYRWPEGLAPGGGTQYFVGSQDKILFSPIK